jgi:hypothetical protein
MPTETILKRDGKTRAITVRFSGGIVVPGDLGKIAAIQLEEAY